MTALLLLPLLLATSSTANVFQFYGGSLVITPVRNFSDGSYEVELGSRQATVRCHVNDYVCLSGDCGTAVDRTEGTVAWDSYGLTWCLKEVRTKLRLRRNTAFKIRYPASVNADNGSGYWIPNTRSSAMAWSMTAHVDLGIRSDTGEPNRPPIATIPPIVRIPRNCPQTFRLTVFDPDGDRVRCRVPTDSGTFECGLCGLPIGFSLDQDSCSLTYAYDGLTGHHSIELVLEDFPHEHITLSYSNRRQRPFQGVSDSTSIWTRQQTSTSPLSKLSLQFTILVDSHPAPSCLQGDYSSIFLAPTPSNQASLPAFVNRTLEVEVRSTAQYTTIRDLIVTGPGGVLKRFIATGIYIVEWKPTDRDLHGHFPVCFISESRDGFNQVYQSEPCCITVHVGHHEVVVTCNQTAMKIELERTYLIKRNEDNLHLKDFRDSSCSLTSHSNTTHLVAFVLLSACGTHVEEDEDTIVFRNKITSSSSGGIISRNNNVDIAISCVYPKKTNITLGFRHKNPYAFKERGFGSFTFHFEFFKSQRFRHQVNGSSYPVEVALKQMIYMQIQATSSIPNTELFVESCKATPDDNPESPISCTIIENGCVRDKTVQIFRSDKSAFRFGMEAFEFIGGYEEVYISCSVILCESSASDTRCSQGCVQPGSVRSKREASAQTSRHSISQGPLHLLKAPDSEGSIWSLNLICKLFLVVGLILVCGVMIHRSRRSTVRYHPLPTTETD